jgi:predicted metal-dependent enzyme (double-stranded beta helix superfamily)
MEALAGPKPRMAFIRDQLPRFLLNTSLFLDLIERIARGDIYPDIGHTDAFDNEILLYMNPKRVFSVRMFLFGPGEFSPIHDHNSWGMIGSVLNALTVVNYRREDDGTVEGYARIHETDRITLSPGEIESTLPLNEGIHETGNATADPMVMVSVYGSPIRRLYVNRYDAEKNRVQKMYAPRMKKKQLAKSTLEFFDRRINRRP